MNVAQRDDAVVGGADLAEIEPDFRLIAVRLGDALALVGRLDVGCRLVAPGFALDGAALADRCLALACSHAGVGRFFLIRHFIERLLVVDQAGRQSLPRSTSAVQRLNSASPRAMAANASSTLALVVSTFALAAS